MPELKTKYLETHKRDICPGCREWVPWYRDSKGKTVYGCQVGEIPYRDECKHFKSKGRGNG